MSEHPSTPQPHDVSVSRCHSLSSRWGKDPRAGQNAEEGLTQPWQSRAEKPQQRQGISAKPQAPGFRKREEELKGYIICSQVIMCHCIYSRQS